MSSPSCLNVLVTEGLWCLCKCAQAQEQKRPLPVALFILSQVAAFALMTVGTVGLMGHLSAIGSGGSSALVVAGVILGLPSLVRVIKTLSEDLTLASCLRAC